MVGSSGLLQTNELNIEDKGGIRGDDATSAART